MFNLRMHGTIWIILVICIFAVVLTGEAEDCIHSVKVNPHYFNPYLNESVELSFNLCEQGSLTVMVLDRDGYSVSLLADAKEVDPGTMRFSWDGKYSDGSVAFDEAYSFKIDLRNERNAYTYFPANDPAEHLNIVPQGYNRRDGFLQYVLPKAARVHVQAGTAVVDPKTKEVQGPVLKTIASRVPRTEGTVLESWDGRDESGTIFVPDLQDFAIAVAATSLPENSVIVQSNRSEKFVDLALKRKGESLIKQISPGPHHMGLSALEDQIPYVEFTPINCRFEESERTCIPESEDLEVRFLLKGSTLSNFLKQPGNIFIYLNKTTVKKITPLQSNSKFILNLSELAEGNHIVSINAASHYGPTAVNAFKIKIDPASRARATTSGRKKHASN